MKQGWEIKKLGEFANIKSGKSIDANQISDNISLYPCYGGNGIRGYVKNYRYNGYFPVIGRVGALCGNVHLAKGQFNATEHALIVEIKNEDINPEWLTYNLISLKLRGIAKGVAQPVIAASEVAKIPISVPPLVEQEHIVAELDCLSSVIEKQKELLKELDNLAQSIFYNMFGDPNNSKYPKVPLCLLSKSKLSYGSGASAVEYDNNIRYIRITDIQEDGKLDNTPMSPSIYDEKYLLNDGDILFARSGATVGKTYLYTQRDGTAIYAGYLIRFVPNKEIVLPEYVFYLTRSEYYKAFIEKNAQAVAQPNINAKQYGDLMVCLPPLTLQRDFSSKIEAIEKQKELLKQSIAETETLFNSRMEYYFN